MRGVAVFLQALDLATFVWIVYIRNFGMLVEANPVVRAIGPGAAIAAKLGLIGFLLWVEPRLRPRRRLRGTVLILAAVAGAFGAWTNLNR